MEKVIIKKKEYRAFGVYNTKKEAFDRIKTISNPASIYETDNNRFAIFLKTNNVSHLY